MAQIPFMMPSSDEHEIAAPQGILTVQVCFSSGPSEVSSEKDVAEVNCATNTEWCEQCICLLQVIEAKLPQRLSKLRRVEKPLDPYTCLAVRPHR